MKSVIDGLPVGWIWASISEIANLASGQTPKGIDRFSNPAGDIPWLRISDMNRIGNERLMNNAEVLVSNQDVRSLGLHVRPAGTIIFPKRGGAIATNKKRLLVRPSAYDLNTMGIISPPELTDYLWWWFATIDLAKLSDGSNVPQINHGDIEFLRVPLPPINEQLRIVAEIEKQFTRLDAAVAALKRVQANLKRYRASVLKAACEGKLVPTEAELARAEGRDYERADKLLERILKERRAKWEANQLAKMKAQGKTPNDDKWKGKYQAPAVPSTSIFPKLPEGWKQVNTEQVTSIITDGEHITPQRSESGVLLLSARNVLDGKLSLRHVDYIPEIEYERISKRLVIEAGDVLLSCSGTVGRSCIAPEKLRFTLVRSVAVLKPFFEMGKFLSLAIRSIQLQSQISTKKTQTAQANIFQGKIKALIFPLPPLVEQQRIVAEVERRLSVIDEIESVVEANLKRATALRQSILKRAFEGKLVPQDPNDEPASVLLERIRAERINKEAETKPAKPTRTKRKGQEGKQDQLPLISKATGTEGD